MAILNCRIILTLFRAQQALKMSDLGTGFVRPERILDSGLELYGLVVAQRSNNDEAPRLGVNV